MFSLLEAVPRSPEMSGWGCCVTYECRKLLYSTASLGNSLACCGNWRSWRSKHHLLWWKMRRKSTKKKIYCYAPLLGSKEQRLLLHRWVTTNNNRSGCEIWPITVRPLLQFHILDFRHVSCSLIGVQTCSRILKQAVVCLLLDQTHDLSVTRQKQVVYVKKIPF